MEEGFGTLIYIKQSFMYKLLDHSAAEDSISTFVIMSVVLS